MAIWGITPVPPPFCERVEYQAVKAGDLTHQTIGSFQEQTYEKVCEPNAEIQLRNSAGL
jgi:hypothetical protein